MSSQSSETILGAWCVCCGQIILPDECKKRIDSVPPKMTLVHFRESTILAVMRMVVSLVVCFIMARAGSRMMEGLVDGDKDAARDAANALRDLGARFPSVNVAELSTHERAAAVGLEVPDKEACGFDAIGGHRVVKRELMLHVVVPMRHHARFFASPALRPPSGVMFEGPPGTGKTMLSKAVAAEAGVPLLCVRSSTIEQKYYGEAVKMVRAIFSLARRLAPVVVFFDEVDGLMRDRARGGDDNGADYSVKTEVLQQMDGVDADGVAIIVIAATNCASKLDAALYRRLPRTYTIGLPEVAARREILERATAFEPEGVTPARMSWLARATEGMSGSDIKDLYKYASALRNEVVAERILAGGSEIDTSSDDAIPCITAAQWKRAVDRRRERSSTGLLSRVGVAALHTR